MDPRSNGHGKGQHQHLTTPSQDQRHQRFSWQSPPEEEAPPYEPPRQPQRRVETDANAQNRGFSYAQTPIEFRDPYYASSQPRPLLPTSPSVTMAYPQSTDTKHSIPVSPEPVQESRRAAPFSPDDFGSHAPQAHTEPHTNHARKLSHLSPLRTDMHPNTGTPVPTIPQPNRLEADPLPHKTPISPISSGPIVNNRLAPTHEPSEPYTPHGFRNSTSHAVFSPHAAHGPNGLDFALHQPGQIGHPNMDLGNKDEFKHSLCDCSGDCSTCLTGLFCPCILYGRTSYRLSRKSDKKDPTDMLGHKATNGHCMLMSVSCGLWWLFPMLQRTRIRHLYKITGSLGSDIVKGCCCCCCVVVQNEREVRSREESARRWAGPASTQVYTASDRMTYAPQR